MIIAVNRATIGIYAIRNVISGDSYVGSSIDVRRRLFAHRSRLRRGIHENTYLQTAWIKYGEVAFETILVESCHSENLLAKEQAHLVIGEGSYNVNASADCPPSRKGQRNTDSQRLKCRVANLGKIQERTAEWNENIGRSLRGKHWKLKKKRAYHPLSESHKAAIAAGILGQRRTPEQIENCRLAARRRVNARLGAQC